MLVRLQARDHRILAAGRLHLHNLQIEGFDKRTLDPLQDYWLRFYAEGGEEPAAWQPVVREDVVVLGLTSGPATEAWEPAAPPGTRLHQRLHFQIDNDRPLSKIVRWGFRDDPADGEYRTWRLPFVIRPRRWARLALFCVFAIGIVLPEVVAFSIALEPSALVGKSLGAFILCVVLAALAARLYESITT